MDSMNPTIQYPFEATQEELRADIDSFVDNTFAALQSSFLLLPRGDGFVSYAEFQTAYEVLKRHTESFTIVKPESVTRALQADALVFVVLRTILGFTPPELAHLASQEGTVRVPQNFARVLDRRVRTSREMLLSPTPSCQARVHAMVIVACRLLQQGAPEASPGAVHRLDKADTRLGLSSVRHLAKEGAPYSMLLYERFLGRPFAGYRDSVSELVGEVMENAVEQRLRSAEISFRKTKRAERIEGFDQAPDFIVPDEWNPQVVVEAKITEDDGTARDKITRIQHLAEISRQRVSRDREPFQVVACIDGRGFGVRREDMRKLLLATQGKVFTLKTLDHLVAATALRAFTTSSETVTTTPSPAPPR